MGISMLVRVRTELSVLTRTGPVGRCPDRRISVALRTEISELRADRGRLHEHEPLPEASSMADGAFSATFAANSFTVLRLE
jgi:hypothetical protein